MVAAKARAKTDVGGAVPLGSRSFIAAAAATAAPARPPAPASRQGMVPLPAKEAGLLQGRWEATGHGLLTVAGTVVHYDKYATTGAGAGKKLILSYCIVDNCVALGDWRTEVNIATKQPPTQLRWTCKSEGLAIVWRRIPTAVQAARPSAGPTQRTSARLSANRTGVPITAELEPRAPAQSQVQEHAQAQGQAQAAVHVQFLAHARGHAPAQVQDLHDVLQRQKRKRYAKTTSSNLAASPQEVHSSEDDLVAALDDVPGIRWLQRQDRLDGPT